MKLAKRILARLKGLKDFLAKRLTPEERKELRAHLVSMLALLAQDTEKARQELRLHLLEILTLLDAEG
jgi:DNA-binding GntR family transcriptional regulator